MTASRSSADEAVSNYVRCSPERVLEREFGHADDAVHGRADLVAHVREEFALGAAGGLGCIARPIGGFLGLAQFVSAVFHQAGQAPLT